jgi:hypothetical protein
MTDESMPIDELYLTGLYAFDAEKYPEGPYSGRGWRAVLQQAEEHNERVPGQQIGIVARSQLAAQKALNVIWSAHGLLNCGPTDYNFWPSVEPSKSPSSESDEAIDHQSIGRFILATHHFPLACMLAAKASQRRDFIYALAKYTLSASIHANNLVDLDPDRGEHLRVSPFPDDQVRFSYGIVTAYAVIEQLGLEVRASEKRPSMIKGVWNQDVKSDLEGRLRKRGIDLSEKISWNVRGSVRRIEKQRPPKSQGKTQWARYGVRDCYVELIDAIADVSWLRSKVSAHKTRELATGLSPYDVANSQDLARRLLLESLGFWKYWGRHGEKSTR